MTRVRFLRDFRSRHTGENFYAAGSYAEFESADARALVDEGAAEMVTIDARAGQASPAPPAMPPAPVARKKAGPA